MSWILYLLQASKLVCHSFLDVDRRQEAPGSETKEFFSFLFFFTYNNAGSIQFLFPLVQFDFSVTQRQCGGQAVFTEFASQWKNSEFKKSQSLKMLPETCPTFTLTQSHYLYVCYINILKKREQNLITTYRDMIDPW